MTGQVGGMYADGNFGFLIRDSVENGGGIGAAVQQPGEGQ